MKSRVILIFFFLGGGNFFRSFCCWVNNSIEHKLWIWTSKQNLRKKSCLGNKTKQIRRWLRVYTSSCFCILTWKEDMTSFPITKCCKINVMGLCPNRNQLTRSLFTTATILSYDKHVEKMKNINVNMPISLLFI